MQEVIGKILLDYVTLIAAANNEIMHAKMRIDFKDMPEYRHTADLDHGFWAEGRFFGYSGAKAASQDHGKNFH